MVARSTRKKKKKVDQALLLLPAKSLTAQQAAHHEQRVIGFGLASLVAFLALALGMLNAFLDTGSFAKVQLPNLPAARNPNSQVLQPLIEHSVKNYRLKIRDAHGTETSYAPAALGINIDASASAAQAEAVAVTGSYTKRIQWWHTVHLPLVLSVDGDILNGFINSHLTRVVKPVKNAVLSIDNGVAKLTPEEYGQSYLLKDAQQVLKSAVSSLRSDSLNLELSVVEPALTQRRLEPIKQSLDIILAQKIELSINQRTVTAKATDIANWLELTPVEADKTVDVTVNSGKVLEYINSIAEPFIQPPRSELVMTALDGSKEVLSPGQSGVDVENKETVAKTVADAVLRAKGLSIGMPVKFAPYKTVSAQPYAKFIVVDTSSKRLYAYERANLINTFLMSAGAPQTPTVLGQFQIYTKIRKQDMRGLNADGSRYFQPGVEWVSYFYQDYAIHGNYWRPLSYFGNVNSSHGCVGILENDASWLYQWAPIGTPVIVHD